MKGRDSEPCRPPDRPLQPTEHKRADTVYEGKETCDVSLTFKIDHVTKKRRSHCNVCLQNDKNSVCSCCCGSLEMTFETNICSIGLAHSLC
jgi:hypothetical protein